MEEGEKNDDWDFDFSMYENESHEEEVIDTIHRYKPKISQWRSRFSLGEYDLLRLADLKKLSSKYYIEVASRTQNISVIWKFYAILEEIWDIISPMFGSNIESEIKEIKKNCYDLMKKAQNDEIPDKLYNNLRFFKATLYKIMQWVNLSFETERSMRGTFSRAKRKIVE